MGIKDERHEVRLISPILILMSAKDGFTRGVMMLFIQEESKKG